MDRQVAPTAWPELAGQKALAPYEIYRKQFRPDAAQPRGAGLFEFNQEMFVLQLETNF